MRRERRSVNPFDLRPAERRAETAIAVLRRLCSRSGCTEGGGRGGGSGRGASVSLDRRSLLLGMAFASVAGRTTAQTAALKPPGLDELYAPPSPAMAALSPNGRSIAVLETVKTGERSVSRVAILNADALEAQRRVIPLDGLEERNAEVHQLAWANDTRLLVSLASPFFYFDLTASTGAQVYALNSRRVISVPVDGNGKAVQLFGKGARPIDSIDLGELVDPLNAEPDHVLMAAWSGRRNALTLYRVNVITGSAKEVEGGGPRTYRWIVDRTGRPIVRFDLNTRRNFISVLGRPTGGGGWKLLRRVPFREMRDFDVLAASDRPDVVYVSARLENEDALSVREFDLATSVYGPPLAPRPGVDASGAVVDHAGRLAAVGYVGDRLEYEFIDKTLAPHHRGLDRFWESTNNIVLEQADMRFERFLGRVSGPAEPGAVIFYDRVARRAETLVSANPGLGRERLARTRAERIVTRDGVSITAYLTRPADGRPGPLVVMPHGGPETRDLLEWNRWLQVLAAQGWWVLQPNFRGSGGYGRAFAEAGHRRWADRMQEDVEDAADHALKAHGLDAGRVAVLGASYGGYAALMGAIRRPAFYRACVSICGVSDLTLMLQAEALGDDTPEKSVYGYWVERIGDPKVDAAAITRASPASRAAEMTAPVLLHHGLDDETVPPEQSRRMRDALKAAGKQVELVEVEGAGHPFWPDPKDRALMEKVTAFIAAQFARA